MLENIWFIVTLLGAPEAWAVLTALIFGAYLAFRSGSLGGSRLKEMLFLLAPTLVLTFLIVLAVKGFIAIPRGCMPCITELVACNPYCPLDSSMPSGHTATAFAGFTVVWVIKGMKKKWLAIYILPALVALSRLMLGVHTFADVFAGAIAGILISLAVWYMHKRI